MLKLKDIITKLDDSTYNDLKLQFEDSKGKNFRFLIESYRLNLLSDDAIMSKLEITKNSFYVLKSRLYDKIQNKLNDEIDVKSEEISEAISELKNICLKEPREIAIAKLMNAEEELIKHNLYKELVYLYSLFKKVYLFSNKYYYYSQQYNKYTAYNIAIEKQIDLLNDFNVRLNNYLFAKNTNSIVELEFIFKETEEYFKYNKNPQSKIIQTLIACQLNVFCDKLPDLDVQETIDETLIVVENLPNSTDFKKCALILKFILFEHYIKTDQVASAGKLYFELEANRNQLLLSNFMACTSRYLLTKIIYLQKTNNIPEILSIIQLKYNLDPFDSYSEVRFLMMKAIVAIYKEDYKSSLAFLNKIILSNSFKDLIYINSEIRILMIYCYINIESHNSADSLFKNLNRKLRSEPHLDKYSCLLKYLNRVVRDRELNPNIKKQMDLFKLFILENKENGYLASWLIHIIQLKYEQNKGHISL
ncbi:MAG: hypothetical protein AB7O73_07340 [Bacteroidia bacterium]